jgi:hypothetical protein
MLALGGLHCEQYEGRCQPAAAFLFMGALHHELRNTVGCRLSATF